MFNTPLDTKPLKLNTNLNPSWCLKSASPNRTSVKLSCRLSADKIYSILQNFDSTGSHTKLYLIPTSLGFRDLFTSLVHDIVSRLSCMIVGGLQLITCGFIKTIWCHFSSLFEYGKEINYASAANNAVVDSNVEVQIKGPSLIVRSILVCGLRFHKLQPNQHCFNLELLLYHAESAIKSHG